MSHRHSCERCRQQKVRCLRDSQTTQKPSPGQSIPKCSRCAKAGTTCVYSLRLRTRRPGSGTGGSISTVNPSLPAAVEKEPTPFDQAEEDTSPYQLDFDGFNWDQLSMFSPMQIGMGVQSQTAVETVVLDLDMSNGTATPLSAERNRIPGDEQWWSGVPSPPSLSPSHEVGDDRMSSADSLSGLTAQATTVSAHAVSATRLLLSPGSAPPTVSSPHVNEAFEGTRTLVRIINNIVAMSSDGGDDLETRPDGSCKAAEIGGLVLTTLACHQHLLAFFRAICESIERCVESVADDKGNGSSTLHGNGPPSTAQFTMVLQLLVHLINRLDRSLFPARPPSPVPSSSTSAYGGAGMDMVLSEADEMLLPDTAGIPSIAQALVRAMPSDHLKLRHTILQLQARMERLEAF
ncbi:hypothetical protein QBC43DRAFT_127902 [Cladorrhinum sp. PSN259]|nr:hypothetical protein QBC43DRAFT_127902 [Cladorrhinum sp. PSN259]